MKVYVIRIIAKRPGPMVPGVELYFGVFRTKSLALDTAKAQSEVCDLVAKSFGVPLEVSVDETDLIGIEDPQVARN